MRIGTARPNNGAKPKSGNYTVPPEIRSLKPGDIPCFVKRLHGGYYVYERLRVPDPNHPGKNKNASGKCIGVIADNQFIPNSGSTLDMCDEDPDNLDYGAYAIALACSSDVLSRIKMVFSPKDAAMIYTIAVIYFVNHYIPARDLHEIYIQSVLCRKFTTVTLSEKSAGEFIEALGRHHKKRTTFEQNLLDNGSGSYNIDGHAILCCSNNNELADYGSKYSQLKNRQANYLMVFDSKKKIVVACQAFDGGMPDKTAVSDTLSKHAFKKARLRIDSGFYAEDNLGLYRKNDCVFVIPVPRTTILQKTLLRHILLEGSFVHRRTDSHGKVEYSSVKYKEYTVSEIEETAIQDAKEEAAQKNAKLQANAKKSDKVKKVYPRTITRSSYPSDRIIIYKDQLMHDKLEFDYRCNIGDGRHTEEELAKLEPYFGIISLRTNDPQITAEDLYIEYKDRWTIETYYSYLKNGLEFKGLHEENFYVQEGVGFLMIVESMIYSNVQKLIKESTLPYVRNMSMDECIRIAGRLRIALHKDNKWHPNAIKGKINDMFEYFNVDVADDVKKLNKVSSSKQKKEAAETH